MWKRISYAIFIFYHFVLFFSLLHFSSFIFLMMIVAMITSLWNVISCSACYASSAWLCVKTYPALWELYVTLLQTLKCQSMPDSNSDKKKKRKDTVWSAGGAYLEARHIKWSYFFFLLNLSYAKPPQHIAQLGCQLWVGRTHLTLCLGRQRVVTLQSIQQGFDWVFEVLLINLKHTHTYLCYFFL